MYSLPLLWLCIFIPQSLPVSFDFFNHQHQHYLSVSLGHHFFCAFILVGSLVSMFTMPFFYACFFLFFSLFFSLEKNKHYPIWEERLLYFLFWLLEQIWWIWLWLHQSDFSMCWVLKVSREKQQRNWQGRYVARLVRLFLHRHTHAWHNTQCICSHFMHGWHSSLSSNWFTEVFGKLK